MVGEKHQGVPLGVAPHLDAANEAIALRDGAAFHDAGIGVVLHAGDARSAIGIEKDKPSVVGEAVIKDHDGPRFCGRGGFRAYGLQSPGRSRAAVLED